MRGATAILSMHCDCISADDVDEPHELSNWISEKLPHDTEAINWSLSQDIPPETVEEEEPTDFLTAKGLALGSAGNGKSPLSLSV